MDVLALAQKADLFAALERVGDKHGINLDDIKVTLSLADGDPEVFESFALAGDASISDEYIHAFMKMVGEKILVPADKDDGIYMNTEGDSAYLLKDSEIDIYLDDLKKAKIPHAKDIGFEIIPEDKGVAFKYNRQNALQIVEAIETMAMIKRDKHEDITASKEKKKQKRDKLKAAAKKAKKKSQTKQDKLAKQFKEILERKKREG